MRWDARSNLPSLKPPSADPPGLGNEDNSGKSGTSLTRTSAAPGRSCSADIVEKDSYGEFSSPHLEEAIRKNP